jgi:O-antigen/teichoic acid export membrane protein
MTKLRNLLLGGGPNRQLLAKNTFWLGLIEVVSKLTMLAVTIMIVRYLGPTEYGVYNSILAYVAILMIVADLGTATIITRDIAKSKEKTGDYVNNSLSIKTASALLIVVVAIIALPLTQFQSRSWLVWLIIFYCLSLQYQAVAVAAFSGLEKMENIFWVRCSFYLQILVSTWLTVKYNGGTTMLVAGFLSAGLVSLLISVWLMNKLKIKVGLDFNFRLWKEIFIQALPILGIIAFSQIYGNFDTLIITNYFDSRAVGIYQAAYKILFAFQSVNIINAVTFPRISALIHQGNIGATKKIVRAIVAFGLLVLIPLSAVITWKSKMIVLIIYGESYAAAAPILIALIWAGTINFFRIMVTNILVALGKQKYFFYSVIIGTVVNALINWQITTKIGYGFAGYGLLISEVIILLASTGWLMGKRNH